MYILYIYNHFLRNSENNSVASSATSVTNKDFTFLEEDFSNLIIPNDNNNNDIPNSKVNKDNSDSDDSSSDEMDINGILNIYI